MPFPSLAFCPMCDYNYDIMAHRNEKIPDPKELEKEIGEFLTKKFGDNVKIVSPMITPVAEREEKDDPTRTSKRQINFDILPEELVSYLDQYIVKQDAAKSVLATKICTHFNRIRRLEDNARFQNDIVGRIKNNVLMIGPTGVGKTYMVKLIAKKIGVPFVKGDATKFSETGYVGGDVEDLVRDLVREADGDIELAQHGIIYIDEIDKIASSNNLIGADVSRTGVQRALLKPMEETEVEMKVPHDPISMIQEIERFRKSGKREDTVVNTRNILFIMSGAFNGLTQIVKKRLTEQAIGFGAQIASPQPAFNVLRRTKSEDLIAFGFESEFIGRLPVKTMFEELSEADLLEILQNPNNPIVLGKKMDFAAYGIDVKFDSDALALLAGRAAEENTGARGLVSAVEEALLLFENKLPSTTVRRFAVTSEMILSPRAHLESLLDPADTSKWANIFERVSCREKGAVIDYITKNKSAFGRKYKLTLTPSRTEIVADYYCRNICDVGWAVQQVRNYYDEVKNIEIYFFNKKDVNIILEDDAIDYIISRVVNTASDFEKFYQQFVSDFEYGLKLVREKTGRSRFFITRDALEDPDMYIGNLLKENLNPSDPELVLPQNTE